MFDIFKDKLKLKKLESGLKIKEYEASIKMMNDVLEVSNAVVDDELAKDWFLIGGSDSSGFSGTEDNHQDMLLSAYKLYHNNPHARAIIRGLVKFVLGKGPQIIFDDENEKVKEAWNGFKRINKFNLREKEIAVRTFRDGECFLRDFVDEENGDTKIRFIRANSIANPKDKTLTDKVSYGIETESDDIETPLKYYKVNMNGDFQESISANNMIHIKILSDSDQKRGISILRVCAKRIRQYDEWLEDRIVLNKIRSAIALIRKVEGNVGKIGSIRDENISTRHSQDRKKQKMFARGTVLTASKGISYEMLSPNINASDVGEDGRAMLLSIAAAVGMPEMIFTADYCHDTETEILTDHGFMDSLEAYKFGFKLGTVSQENGKLEYQNPINWVFSKYNGRAFLFEGNRLNFLVTKNHHMWLRSESSHKLPIYRQDRGIDNFTKCTLGDTSDKGWRTKFSSIRNFIEPAENEEKNNEYVCITKYDYPEKTKHLIEGTNKEEDRFIRIDKMIEFIGWFVSEGSVNKKSGHVNICQTYKNEENVNEIKKLISELPFDFKYKEYENLGIGNEIACYWRTYDQALASWLRTNCGVGSRNKKLPEFVWALSTELKEKLLDTLIKGDGSDYKEDSDKVKRTFRRYYSNSLRLVNDVQRLAFELGYHTTSSLNVETKDFGDSVKYVNISDGHNCMVLRKNIEQINYNGNIWCATVPNGLLVTRRKGRILISGNSNANYSSSLIAQNPWVREIEDWQDFFASFYEDLVEKVINNKIKYGDLPEDTKTTCRVEFPPMIQADLDKLAKAYETLFKYKAVSKRTWDAKMGLDYDIEKGNMEGEDDDEFTGGIGGNQFKSPFNMPVSPINQYGSNNELNEAIDNEDYDKIIKICENIGGIPQKELNDLIEIIKSKENIEKNISKTKILGLQENIKNLLKEHKYDFDILNIEEAEKLLAEQDWIYLIHHMHQPKKESEMEILHHCELYEKKDMKGIKFQQKHIKDGKIFQHVLDIEDISKMPKIVYDHLNNGFKVKIKEINKIEYAVLWGLASVKKTKWSDQDK